MNFIIWIMIGGTMGWLAGRGLRPADPASTPLHVVVGIVGALIGEWLVSPLVGFGTISYHGFSLGVLMQSTLLSVAGAAFLLAVIILFQRGTLR